MTYKIQNYTCLLKILSINETFQKFIYECFLVTRLELTEVKCNGS